MPEERPEPKETSSLKLNPRSSLSSEPEGKYTALKNLMKQWNGGVLMEKHETTSMIKQNKHNNDVKRKTHLHSFMSNYR